MEMGSGQKTTGRLYYGAGLKIGYISLVVPTTTLCFPSGEGGVFLPAGPTGENVFNCTSATRNQLLADGRTPQAFLYTVVNTALLIVFVLFRSLSFLYDQATLFLSVIIKKKRIIVYNNCIIPEMIWSWSQVIYHKQQLNSFICSHFILYVQQH